MKNIVDDAEMKVTESIDMNVITAVAFRAQMEIHIEPFECTIV